MDPVTIITTLLGLVGTAIKSYNSIKEIKDLPEAFKEVERQLPLVQNILTDIRKRLNSSQITDADKTILQDQIIPCEKDAKTLNEIFEKLAAKCVEDQNDTKTWAKARAWYREALRGMKARQVESLMEKILERVKSLALKEVFGVQDHLNHIKEALDHLSQVDASLDDSELETAAIRAQQQISDHATGTQFNLSGGTVGAVNAGSYSGLTFRDVQNLTLVSHSDCKPSTAPMMQSADVPRVYNKSRPIHFIPLHENGNFVGRADIVKKLRAMLKGKKHQRVALHGLGGVGKTQIALSLAYWAQENMPGYSVFWLSALSMANFEQSCRDLIEDVSLPCLQGQTPQDSLKKFLSSEKSGLWLLVIDNIDDETSALGEGGISSYFPKPRNKRSLTIFTTRSRKIAREMSNYNILQLQEMSKDEAKTLLKTLVGPDKLQDKDTAIASLLEELTYLPLAINHAAAYIDQNGISAKEYLDLMRNSERDLVELLSNNLSSETGALKARNAVATTWLLSFEKIRNADRRAGVILSSMSQIEPKAISRSILPEFETKQQQVSAIGLLNSYAFITKRSKEKYDMHSLVHLAAKIWVERQGERYLTAVIEILTSRLLEVYSQKDLLWAAHLPHALKILKASEDLKLDSEEQVFLYHEAGTSMAFFHKRHEAARLLRQGLQLAEKLNFQKMITVLQLSEATILTISPNIEERERAAKLTENAVEAFKSTYPAEHPYLLTAQLTLAYLYKSTNRPKDAMRLVDSVSETCATVLQDSGFLVPALPARRQHKFALTSAATQVIEKAMENEAVGIGKYTPDFIVIQVQIALLYLDLDGKDSRRGLDLLEHTWKAAASYYGQESHPHVLQVQWTLGGAYESQGQRREAFKLLKEVVKLCEQDEALADSWIATEARSVLDGYGISGLLIDMSSRISSGFKLVFNGLILNKKGGKEKGELSTR